MRQTDFGCGFLPSFFGHIFEGIFPMFEYGKVIISKSIGKYTDFYEFFSPLEKKKEIINDLSRVSILSMPFHQNSMLEQKFTASRYTASKANKTEMEWEIKRDCNGIYSKHQVENAIFFTVSFGCNIILLYCLFRSLPFPLAPSIVHIVFELNAVHILGFRGRLKSTFALFMMVFSIFLAHTNQPLHK